MRDPWHGVDLCVRAPLRVLIEVWMGRRDLSEALKSDAIELEGAGKEIRKFSK